MFICKADILSANNNKTEHFIEKNPLNQAEEFQYVQL